MSFDKFNTLDFKPLIAKTPNCPRDFSKLLVVSRQNKKIEHKIFRDIVSYLNPKDCLVLNNSKVFPAKLLGRKSTGGKFELLLVRPLENNKWLCLTPECRKGMEIILQNNVRAKSLDKNDEGYWIFEFSTDDIPAYSKKYGIMPLPPYIEKARKKCKEQLYTPRDKTDYQTVYAKYSGSIAAPTAGLHFTSDLLKQIEKKGVKIVLITLHIGWGTFRPLRSEPAKHKMSAEFAEITRESADIINSVKKSGGRIFSVGTTATRTLESFAEENGSISSGQKWADLFIYPPYEFKIIDCLITNFHLPGHTPLCLTAAFTGEELLFKAYKQAVEKRYRFYSYGDAMLIL